MEESLIIFDKEKLRDSLTGCEINYLEFLDLSDSFLGWLLTLSKDEFEYVYKNITHNFDLDPDGGVSLLFFQIGLIHKGQDSFLASELAKALHRYRRMVRLIALVKAGALTYIVGETDLEWKWELTEVGKELADESVGVELFNEIINGKRA